MPNAPANCKGRETGCLGTAKRGARCDVCREIHNAREAQRREARRKSCACWVCGAAAVQEDGSFRATCAEHRTYRNDRVRALAATE